jgi:sodium-dependent dicarboxylate transporter 2/3/5
MSETTLATKKTKNAAYYLKSLIGLAIMLFFGYIPAPAPMTQLGMIVIGQFLGMIFLWTFVDIVWPTFAAIIMFGFIAKEVYPGSFALAGVYEAGMQSIGNWCTVIVIALLIFCEALNETGLIRRIAFWFLTRKTAKRSPWGFTFMFLLSALVIGVFMDVSIAQVFMLAIAKEVFTLLGMEKEDKWTKVITIGISFTVVIAFAITPICHTLPILFMGIYGAIAQTAVNWVSYMLIAIPVGIVIWLGIIGFMKFIVRPDVKKLENIDFVKIDALRPGTMSKREKAVITLGLLLVVAWVLPGFLSILAPTAALTGWFNMITLLTPLLAVIVIMAVVRVEGRPLLDIPAAASKMSWTLIFFLAGIMLIASAMGEAPTGIPDWCMSVLGPMVQGMSPFAMVTFLAIASAILTNFANNVPVGIVFITVGVPLSLQMGINPFITAVAIAAGSNFAYCIPPAFVPVGICYADPFGGGKYTFRWGLVALIITCIACCLIYPLGMIFG